MIFPFLSRALPAHGRDPARPGASFHPNWFVGTPDGGFNQGRAAVGLSRRRAHGVGAADGALSEGDGRSRKPKGAICGLLRAY
jgi:hypothetical protein